MLKKQLLSMAIAGALACMLGACGASGDPAGALTPEAGQTYTGTVSAVSADALTLTVEDVGEVEIPLSESTVFSRNMGDGEAPPDNGGETPPDGGEAPDAPAQPTGAAGDETPPQPPEGQDGGTPPQGGGPGEALTYESLSVGDTVTVTVGSDGTAETVTLSGSMGGPGGQAQAVTSYNAANEYTEDAQVSGGTLDSTGADENAVLVDGTDATVSLDGVTISRTSTDSTGGDQSSFYGVGAAALVTAGTLQISDSTIHSDAAGGAGVFAYGDGTAYVSDTDITTRQDTSGGIHVAGGGTLYAWDLTVETDGESSAAIRSDRGSGTMVVDGGSYTANGVGSPAVYSTADITVHSAALTATGSEAVCIEGLNTIRLFDCDLTGHMQDLAQNDCTWNVILYQSMSGDSQVGNSTFEMVGGTLTAQNGGMFYTTNTESTFLLSGVEITSASDNPFFLKCTGNSNQRGWGTAGANGADCHFTARSQAMEGDVIWDSISQLDFYILEGSTLTGAVRQDESCAGSGGDGYANLYLDKDSTWVVTGDSVLTSLACAGSIVDADGAPVTVQGADGTVYVSGSSPYTVTVTSYFTSVDASGASTVDSWSQYAVERP